MNSSDSRSRWPLALAALAGLSAGWCPAAKRAAAEPVAAAIDRLPPPPAGATPEVGEAMRRLAAAIPAAAGDPTRPAWHFRPPAQWMNDVCGAIHVDGWYHVFYQLNPTSPEPSWHPGQTSAWGHARSRDLVVWEHLPIAIAAVAAEGELRCNSGCVVLDDEGTATIFYTYVPRPGYEPPPDRGWTPGDRQQMIATSRDGLVTWQRSPRNPVVPRRATGIPATFDRFMGWSDPFVFRLAGSTFVTFKAAGGLVCRAEAADFTCWSYAGQLTAAAGDTGPAAEAGEAECPNLVPLGDRWLLIESSGGGSQQVRYRSGRLDPESLAFRETAGGIVDHAYGPKWPGDATRGFYGTSLMQAPDGRVLLFGWAGGYRPGRAWNSCMGLPREVSLDEAGRLLQEPARELERLRTRQRGARDLVVGADPWLIEDLGNLLELDLEVAAEASFAIELPAAAAGGEPIRIAVAAAAITLGGVSAAIAPAPGGTRRLRVFVDRTLVEVFVDGRTALTQEVPCVAAEGAVRIVTAGPPLRIDRADAWALAPIWQEEAGRRPASPELP